MSELNDRASFLAALDRELRMAGRARARIIEEVDAHLEEAVDNPDALIGFGSPEVLARGFNDLHATESAGRVLSRLTFVGPVLFLTYLSSFLLVWSGALTLSPTRRLTPRLYEDAGLFMAGSTAITTMAFVAVTLSLAAFVVGCGLPPLRRRAAIGLGTIAATGVPPLAALAYFAAPDDPWPLAPSGVTAALSILLALGASDRRKTAVTFAVLAIATFGSMICASAALTVLNGLPAPTTSVSAIGYLNLALLPVCIASLVEARRTRLRPHQLTA